MRNFLLLFLLLSINYSCKKNKPPKGNYIVTFNFENPSYNESIYLNISESNSNYFIFKHDYYPEYIGDTIFKDGHEIIGNISSQYFYHIKGSWTKKNDYRMSGSFTQTKYFANGSNATFEGTFEINKSE